jgi:hypothetical protein
VERVFFLFVVAVTWPLWLPFLRLVLAEIRLADQSEVAPPAPPPAPERPSRRLANAGWDSAHLQPARSSRGPRSAFRDGRGPTRG